MWHDLIFIKRYVVCMYVCMLQCTNCMWLLKTSSHRQISKRFLTIIRIIYFTNGMTGTQRTETTRQREQPAKPLYWPCSSKIQQKYSLTNSIPKKAFLHLHILFVFTMKCPRWTKYNLLLYVVLCNFLIHFF